MVKCGPASSAVHLIWGNSKTEDRSPAMVVNTTLVVSTTLRQPKSRQPPPHERGER